MPDPLVPGVRFTEELWARLELEAFGPGGAGEVARPRRWGAVLAVAAAVTAVLVALMSALQLQPRAVDRVEVADLLPSPSTDPRPVPPAPAAQPQPVGPPLVPEPDTGGAVPVPIAQTDAAPVRPGAAPAPQGADELLPAPGAASYQIAFGVHSGGDGDDIVLMDLGSGSITPLYGTPFHDVLGDFSPDGRSLALHTTRHAEHDEGRVYVVDVGGESRRVTSCGARTSDCSDAFPTWSPDGDLLAFMRGGTPDGCSDACTGIFVVRPDGTGLRRVADGTLPDWSPDGQQLVFVLPDPLDPTCVVLYCPGPMYVVNVDGTGLRSLGVNGASPKWSPDGSRIAYWDDLSTETGVEQVRTVRPDGSGDRRILPPGHYQPAWSPDGRLLLSITSDGQQQRLWVSDPDGGGLRELPATPGDEVLPVFRPRG